MGFNKKFFTTGGIAASTSTPSIITGANLKINLDVDNYSSGTVADLSGNNNVATLNGNVTHGTDSNGGGFFELDGSGDFLEIAASADFNTPSSFTAEGYFNPDNLTAVDHLISGFGAGAQARFYSRILNSSGDFDVYIYPSAGNIATSNASARLIANQWNHFVISFSSNNSLDIYLNAVLAGTVSSGSSIQSTTTTTIAIGVLQGHVGSFDFDGKVGAFRFYNIALTAAQVLQNFNASKGKYGI